MHPITRRARHAAGPRPGGRAAMALLVTVATMSVSAAPVPAVAAGCSPTPTYDPDITTPEAAISGYSVHEASTQQIEDYYALVTSQSRRVAEGTFATSWNGVPLIYALVTDPGALPDVDRIAADVKRLWDPRVTSSAQAATIAATRPAIVWYTANVHGNEPSGGDAAVQILYELAARTDCAARALLKNLVVGLIPIQNPDGRNADTRRNAYGFDMNRDWSAQTQPETIGKVNLLTKYPPVLDMDAHENSSGSFFFPPNADPVYHEVSPQTTDWVNNLYGGALAARFAEEHLQDPQHWTYYNYSSYDFFAMEYGDTVPSVAYTAGGMTFEKGQSDTYHDKWLEQWTAGWTSIETASANKESILNGLYQAHVDALQESQAGQLEPNQVYEPGHQVRFQVPDLTIRNYFIPGGPVHAYPEVSRLIERLLRMDVEIYRLDADLPVQDLRHYGRAPAPGVVPAGSYWIPMAQPQARWVQAMLGEDSYVPFPYFYDVTAWSNPLLMNLDATFTGSSVTPAATLVAEAPAGRVIGDVQHAAVFWFPGDSGEAVGAALQLARDGFSVERQPNGAFDVRADPGAAQAVADVARSFVLEITAVPDPPPPGTPVTAPNVAVFAPASGGESLGHLRFVLDQVWRIPYRAVSGAQVAGGALDRGDIDVFVVAGSATGTLDPAAAQVRSWIEAGGTFVGTARSYGGGTLFAVGQGLTTSQLSAPPSLSVPGTLFRVAVSAGDPVTLGAPPFDHWFNLGEQVLSPSTTGTNAAAYPSAGGDFWYSGYAKGQRGLVGSAALVDETLGSGHVVLFSGEPNYRAATEGSAFLLANAIAYPQSAGPAGVDVGSSVVAGDVAAARASAPREIGPGRPIQIEVPAAQRADAVRVIRALGADPIVRLAGGSAFVLIPNPAGLDVEEHPFAWRLLPALAAAAVTVRSAIL